MGLGLVFSVQAGARVRVSLLTQPPRHCLHHRRRPHVHPHLRPHRRPRRQRESGGITREREAAPHCVGP